MQVISKLDVTGKKILLRMDLDVPVEEGKVTDDFRLRAGLPTLRHLMENGAAGVTVIGHRGQPEGEDPKLLLKPVVEHLQNLLEKSVNWRENLRFNPGKTGNDANFAQQLAENQELYVNEAFAASHRAND